jgi:hypothetical protein
MFGRVLRCAALAAVTSLPLHAQLFSGRDVETGVVAPSATTTPGTWNARLSMLSALGASPITTNSFESVGLGQITNLGGGVTATYTAQLAEAGVQATNNPTFGWNTSAAGSRHFRMLPVASMAVSSITLSFATPITFFGGYFTGVENGCGQTRVLWGTDDFLLPNTTVNNSCASTTAGIQWFGFISNTAVSTVTLRQQHARSPDAIDFLGLDDMMYGTTTTVVPEPSTYALLAAGLSALALVVRRRRVSPHPHTCSMRRMLAGGAAACLMTSSSLSAQVIFTGVDAGTGIISPSATNTPRTWAARSTMLTALGPTAYTTNTFESLALGEQTDLGQGVTANYVRQFPGLGGVSVGATVNGWNTTAGGRTYLSSFPDDYGITSSIELNFAAPTTFFGAFVSGSARECGTTRVIWDTGSFVLPTSNTTGSCDGLTNHGLQWIGLTSATAFSRVTFRSDGIRRFGGRDSRDIFGIDDMIYATAPTTTVPEPSTFVLLAAGLATIAGVARRRSPSS